MRKRVKRKIAIIKYIPKIFMSKLGAFLSWLFLINHFTVYPFMWLFRTISSNVAYKGNKGPYAEDMARVKAFDSVRIPLPDYPDARATFYRDEFGEDRRPAILYIHGGAWGAGSAREFAPFVKLLASNGYVAVNMDYSLAPMYKYPISTIQAAETLNHIYEHGSEYGIDSERIFIGGNSAGCHLAAQLGALAGNPKYAEEVGIDIRVPREAVKGLLLYDGVFDFKHLRQCHFPGLEWFAWAYTGKKKYWKYDRIEEMSPVYHVTKNYPAAYITVGDADPLKPQTEAMIKAMKENDVEYEALLWDDSTRGLYHDYIFDLDLVEARISYDRTVDFLLRMSKK